MRTWQLVFPRSTSTRTQSDPVRTIEYRYPRNTEDTEKRIIHVETPIVITHEVSPCVTPYILFHYLFFYICFLVMNVNRSDK